MSKIGLILSNRRVSRCAPNCFLNDEGPLNRFACFS